ncbi:DUF2441 domain-containing protein [Gracilibacillus oryzae]|uniref:DUF2441 domain-containing protein n=1 Tax=Gracilibacillus oryzae TaxID=1672701 RepID=A0A7C8KU36_9BACI|nr:DUF2441 domain-containing protein [Gracilibacillus oryzae]KAB8135773.1 DUF2441 domain-containing protein [Gracilibacillus oryzae]
MKNNTLTAYHLVTKQKMTLGQIIHIDKNQQNQLYRFFLEKEHYNSNGEDFIQILKNGYTNKGIFLDKENSEVALKYMDQTIRAIREVIVEMVRLQEFPQYPSRLSCLFASKTYQDALKWKELFDSYNRKVLQIVKLQVKGSYFEGDANLLPKEDGISFAQKMEQAKEYWKGNRESGLLEVLVNGEIKVIEILDNADE